METRRYWTQRAVSCYCKLNLIHDSWLVLVLVGFNNRSRQNISGFQMSIMTLYFHVSQNCPYHVTIVLTLTRMIFLSSIAPIFSKIIIAFIHYNTFKKLLLHRLFVLFFSFFLFWHRHRIATKYIMMVSSKYHISPLSTILMSILRV